MLEFRIKAKDRSGNNIEEIIEAPDKRAAAVVVRERGLYPLEITPVHSSAKQGPVRIRGSILQAFYIGVNIRTLAITFTQISTMLKAGMSLQEALYSQSVNGKGRLKIIMGKAMEAVQLGRQFSTVLEEYPAIFNNLVVSMVKAGENSGLLDVMTARVAENLEFEINIRRSFSKVMVYPYLILLFAVLIPHVPALVLHGTEEFVSSLWSSLRFWLPWLVVALVAVKIVMQFHTAKMLWDSIKIKPPIIGAAAAKIAYSRFSRALSSLYSAGMPMHESLRIAADASGNLFIAAKLKPAVAAVSSGKNFKDSLSLTGALPPMLLDMLAVGEKTGDYQVVLDKASDFMEAESEASFSKASVMLFVLCILIAGVVVGGMVMKFYVGAASGVLGGGEL